MSPLQYASAPPPDPEAQVLIGRLTRRERDVLRGILDGVQNKIIAYRLGLSVRTVEAYRANLICKLNVRSTIGAVRVAIAAGLTTLGSQQHQDGR